MRRAARIAVKAAAVLAAALAVAAVASTVGWTPAQEVTVLGPDREPVGEGWVGYYYAGSRFNLVCSILWFRPGGAATIGPDGRARLPGRAYLKRPLDGRLRTRTLLVYAPALHNTGDRRLGPRQEPTPRRRTVVLDDLGDDPAAWQQSMHELESFVWRALLAEPDRDNRIELAPEQLCALAAHLRAEYQDFLARYADRPREGPAEAVAREPLWEPFAERIWSRDLDSLDRRLADRCGP